MPEHRVRLGALLLWLLCACWPAAFAGADAGRLTLQPQDAHHSLEGWLLRWVDPSAQAAWPDAQQRLARGEFKPVGALGGAGFTAAAHWYTLTLQRTPGAAEAWVLAIGAPYLDDVQVWLQLGDQPVRHVQMGDRHLSRGRPLAGRQHALSLSFADADDGADALAAPLRVWIRVRSASALNVSVDLWQPAAYFDHETQTVAAWGVVVGLLLLAALTQLLFGLWLRDGIMLAFAGFIGALCLVYFGTSGLALLALGHPPPWFSDLVVGTGSLGSAAAASLLATRVLQIRQHFRRLHWLYLGPAIAILAALPLTVTDLYGPIAGVVNLWGMGLGLLNIGMALWLWRRQPSRLHLLYALAAVSIGAGVIAIVLTLLGVLPSTALTRNAYQASAVVYLVLMLVAMAMRMASLRHDKLLAQERVQEERQFAAIVAHEFRNPLAGIDRAANLLQLFPDMTPEQAAQRLGGIRRQVGRLNILLDSFLNAEAGESRPLQLTAAPLAMSEWLVALKDKLDDDARSRLVLAVEPPGLTARFDPRLLALALNNLIDNALRYSPEDRPVHVDVRIDTTTGGLLLVVTDQGPGLPPEDLRHLGQPHYRGATAVGRQGTGLGYYFCQRIAQIHGGQLQAATVQPHGLAVTLSLPLAA